MLTLEINNRIAHVVLNRPEKHNAFDDSLIADLTQAFLEVEQDASASVMILSSNGKSFSAGADLGWMQKMANFSYEENLQDAENLADMLRVLYNLTKPTIAKVQGAAFGGAVGLVSCCDIAVGSEKSSFCLSEVKLGLIPATISPYVIQAVGPRAAKRYFLTAERFDAAAAMNAGLLHHVCEAEALDEAVERIANALLNNGPRAVSESKKLVSDYSNRTIDQALIADSSARIAATRVSNEGQEGLRAFFEKRKPSWIDSSTQSSSGKSNV